MEDSGHTTPKATSAIQARKAALEKLSNPSPKPSPAGITPKKPSVPSNLQGLKPVSEDPKPSFVKPNIGVKRHGGSFSANNKESDAKVTFPKPSTFKSPDVRKDEPKDLFNKPKPFGVNSGQENKFGPARSSFQPEKKENEEKPVFPKPSAVRGFNSVTDNESKPAFPKKPVLGAKISLNVDAAPAEKHVFVPKNFSTPQESKPFNQPKEPVSSNEPSSPSSQPFPGVKLKPTGLAQSPFLQQDNKEHGGASRTSTMGREFPKPVQDNNISGTTKPKFSHIQSPFISGQKSQEKQKDDKDPLEPKRKPLPPLYKLGPPPAKPPRPPNVNLEKFKGGRKNVVTEQKSSALHNALPPPPPPSVPVQSVPPPPPNNVIKQTSGPPLPPNLPPRNIRPSNESAIPSDEDNYDDVLHEGHSNAGDDMSFESEGEVYEGIDDSVQTKREIEAKKEKEEKKRLEQAKKEQKEREKKEQEIRKRFKLTGRIEVLHQARACNDYKGGKNELTFKHGDQIEIIRITENPEGKWLGRMKGNIGYIKTTMVTIDYDSLKRKRSTMGMPAKPEDNDPEIYDDVGEQDSTSSQSASGSCVFPPPPSDDIYDGVEEDNTRLPSMAEDGDVYDDVDTNDFPPPPMESSLVINSKTSTLGRSLDKDGKTLKKLEKEEKEFRKKFKYTGEIRVLSSIQVLSALATKKWGSKDLPLKPGESLDVIQNTNETTILCRNNEGKYGYVLRSNLVDMDGEIYDDIGEECIYDND
ncbi:FYN-binding protein 1 isoform 2-T2 [Discoglossus pictus]